ncbi:transducin family protein / WD-40 repeat family protein [Prunus dulcis]|uniref:Transducin family protein / WD-40 repeat family protein n=1 Tax=Prunus dulcis TaxID=3755 RepID=A0A4Y1QVF1_PRUDU|nr:transducin family protein / WD-40 repeat family protein [Prunus dulcis]
MEWSTGKSHCLDKLRSIVNRAIRFMFSVVPEVDRSGSTVIAGDRNLAGHIKSYGLPANIKT